MKISPMAQGTSAPGVDIGSVSIGRTSPERLAAAKAVANGQPLPQQADPQIQQLQHNIKKIKMHTQRSTDRQGNPVEQVQDLTEVQPTETIETAQPGAAEETKQALSPQLVALAKAKRALQIKEREIQQREAALTAKPATEGTSVDIARLKADPMGVLTEAGLSYDDLTKAVLNSEPAEIRDLKAKIEALEGNFNKKLEERDTQQEQQVYAEIAREARDLSTNGDEFKYVRAMRKQSDAVELIKRTWKASGEVIPTDEALRLVDAECKKEYEALNSALTPAQAAQAASQINQPQGMKTLTNRDGASPLMDRRSRAIAAALGTLKR